jgi:hypothetical protein
VPEYLVPWKAQPQFDFQSKEQIKVRGGPRPGAGRPKGSSNSVLAREKMKAAAIAKKKGEDAIRAKNLEPFDGDELAYLVSIYKDGDYSPEMRMQAAQAAAPYERPRLSSVDAKVDQRTTHLSGEDPGDALVDSIVRRAKSALRAGNGSDPEPHSGTTH